AIDPTALVPARGGGLVTAQARSMPHYRRKLPLLAASRLVVNAIVLDRRTPWLTVPDSNRPCGRRLEHNLADCVANQVGDAAPRPRGGLAQRIELFLAEVNLGLFHVCHFSIA